MRRCVAANLGLIVLISILGCGKEESASSSTPSDPNAPMAGSAPTKSSQFLGKWVAVTEGALETFEFMADGKVLVTDVIARAMGVGSIGKTFDYKVLEGGRLSMVAPDGLTAIYDVTFSGDQMEIRGDAVVADNDFQRFRKLKAGETVESVKKAAAEAKAKAYQERVAAVEAFLKQPNLVLAMGTSRNIALEITPQQGGFAGKAWHGGNPAHLDEIGGQLVQNDRQQTIQLRINFGRQIDPPVAGQSGGGGVTLDVTGEGSNLKMAGKAQIGAQGTPFEIALKSDSAAHGTVVKAFEAEMARVAALKKPIIDALKDYVVITGESGVPYNSPNMPTETTDRIVLIKGPQPGTWVGQGGLTDKRVGRVEPLQPIGAVVDVVDNKPMLILNAPTRQYQLTLDSSGKKLNGGWFPPGNTQGKVAEYEINEALDAAGRTAQIEEQKKVLASMGGDAPFIGVYRTNSNDQPFVAVSIALKPGSNGAMTGAMTYLTQGNASLDAATMLTDSFDGPALQVRQTYAGTDNGLANLARSMTEPLIIRVVKNSAGESEILATSSATKTFKLVKADDAYRAKQKQTLVDAMKGGMKFKVAHPVRNPQANGALEMKVDPATGKITGSVTQVAPNVYKLNSAIEGEVKEEFGHLMLATKVIDPVLGNQFRATYVTNFAAWQTPEGWIGITTQFPEHQIRARAYVDIAEVK